MRGTRGIVPLLGELKREAEGGGQIRVKESRHRGNLPQIARRSSEGDDLKRERSIGPYHFVRSIHDKSRLPIGTCWR